mmetsp:Transcript_7650/g.19651  ORF Transcript_7650/g.19651 Transcript_7650/m.19651 type:complete len:329 (+) Transcript_7650:522-1508(+)
MSSSEEELSSEEEDIVVPSAAVNRSRRKNAGVARASELVGEDAEMDAAVWNDDTWKEDQSDGEYSEEEVAPDVFDSDFNESESDDDSGGEGEETLRKNEKKRKQADNARKSTYKEPGAVKKRPKKAAASSGGGGGGANGEAAGGALKKLRKRPSDMLTFAPQDRAVRASTTSKSKASEVTRVAELKAARALAAKKPKKKEDTVTFTQEEMLTEAVGTEADNRRWILSMQRAAREKAQSGQGPTRNNRSAIRFLSRRGATPTITFSEVEAQPEFFRPDRAKPRPVPVEPSLCHVTGLPAKYRDPLTGYPYATAAAFKAIREEHNAQRGR